MRTHGTKIVRRIARLTMHNPDQLWQQYALVFSLFLGLTLATYWLNGSVIERGIAASAGITASNQQVLLAQKILELAEERENLDAAEVVRLVDKVAQFETTHLVLMAARPIALSVQASDHTQRMDEGVRAFVALSKSISNAPAVDGNLAFTELRNLYQTGGLHDDLLMAATLIAQWLEAETAYFTTLQRLFLGASAFVVVAEAIFVFWPAQYTVQSTIAKMKRQTNVLRRSQTRLRQVNIQLKRTVNHNQLTGLPNRLSLETLLGNAIRKRRTAQWPLYLVGLDDFKSINDMLGHVYGDALLIAVSRALHNCVDAENIVAHVSGDEFVLISDERPQSVLNRIKEAVGQPFDVNGRRISVKASIGHLCIGEQIREPTQIVADAAIALQSAKGAGGDRTQEFT